VNPSKQLKPLNFATTTLPSLAKTLASEQPPQDEYNIYQTPSIRLIDVTFNSPHPLEL